MRQMTALAMVGTLFMCIAIPVGLRVFIWVMQIFEAFARWAMPDLY